MKNLMGVAAIAGLFMVGGAACANKVNMDRSTAVPSAEAKVKVKDKGDNVRQVKLAVEHLAPVKRVSPDASHYVVWLQPKEGQAMPMNIGVLNVDDDLEAELETTTPYKEFDLFVTTESEAQATAPRGERVLWATVD